MNKGQSVNLNDNLINTDLTSTPIRSQLLWASLFPLLIFGLLTILVMSTVLGRSTLDLARQRNTAWVQLAGNVINVQLQQGHLPTSNDLKALSTSLGMDPGAVLLLIDEDGTVLASSSADTIPDGFLQKAPSQSDSSAIGLDGWMTTTHPLSESYYQVVLAVPENDVLASQRNYQALMAVLILLGVGLSLVMLSLSIDRVIRPIRFMSQQASEAVPGSTFRPLRETGPKEIRALINAFNKMVIRLAKQQSEIRQYAHKALLSQEEERLRLSRELHDGTLQDLVALNQRVELCQNELQSDRSQARTRLVEIHNLLQTTISDVRRISIALRPPVLEDFGLVAAVKALCKEMGDNKPNLTCEFKVNGEVLRLSADLELAVFRVIQEALTNIQKHVPGSTRVNVTLTYAKKWITTIIINNGGSFSTIDTQRHVRSGHLGLAGMQERAKLFNGSFNIATLEGNQTKITLALPISQAEPPVQ